MKGDDPARRPDGSLWILDYSITNAVCVRRIDRGGRVTIF